MGLGVGPAGCWAREARGAGGASSASLRDPPVKGPAAGAGRRGRSGSCSPAPAWTPWLSGASRPSGALGEVAGHRRVGPGTVTGERMRAGTGALLPGRGGRVGSAGDWGRHGARGDGGDRLPRALLSFRRRGACICWGPFGAGCCLWGCHDEWPGDTRACAHPGPTSRSWQAGGEVPLL